MLKSRLVRAYFLYDQIPCNGLFPSYFMKFKITHRFCFLPYLFIMFLILKFTHLDIEIYVKLDLLVSLVHMSPNI